MNNGGGLPPSGELLPSGGIPPNGGPLPTLIYEQRLWRHGYRRVAGLDEVGRGAWAGPVVAAAVILPPDDPELHLRLNGVRDSKTLTATQRRVLLEVIQQHALAWGIGAVPPAEIDQFGIVCATRKAMALALLALSSPADYLLIDHLTLPDLSYPQHSLPKGDARILSIAAASIVAKVSRDRMMVDLDMRFPGYGFCHHKGYGTEQHQRALAALGPSALHRLSFAPLRRLVVGGCDPAAITPAGQAVPDSDRGTEPFV